VHSLSLTQWGEGFVVGCAGGGHRRVDRSGEGESMFVIRWVYSRLKAEESSQEGIEGIIVPQGPPG
jgi:hypothetical protein